jgi:hypothetical protein
MRIVLTFAIATLIVLMWTHPLLSHENVSTTVTFDREIIRILNKKCVACHSDSNLGMPLTSYEETRPWSRSIEEEVLRRHMPPWRAVSGYGAFVNDIGMTNRETQFIVAWVEGNGPKSKDQQVLANFGDAEHPDGRLKPDFGKWQLGKPDLLKTFPSNSILPGHDGEVRRVTIDLGLTADGWIRALEFKPGDRRVVRAAFFSLQETGQWLGSWTPWYGVTTLPRDTAYRAPAGSHVVAEIHYQSAPEPVNDKSSLGIYVTPKPALHQPANLVVEAKAAGPLEAQKVSGTVKIPAEVNIIAFRPEIPPGIESMDVTARKPDGTVEVLLLIRHVLPEWPTPYILAQPVALPQNTELSVNGYYDKAIPLPATLKLTVSLYSALRASVQKGP